MGRNEIIIIALVVVLLFGAPRLPQLARSIGKSMRILRDETRNIAGDDKKPSDDPASADGPSTVDGAVTRDDGSSPSNSQGRGINDDGRDKR